MWFSLILRNLGRDTLSRVVDLNPFPVPDPDLHKNNDKLSLEAKLCFCCYHVTIVAIGHGLLKKFWPLALGCVLRTAGSSII